MVTLSLTLCASAQTVDWGTPTTLEGTDGWGWSGWWCTDEVFEPWDVDGDGRVDLVFNDSPGIGWFQATGDGYGPPQQILPDVVATWLGVGDVDNDGVDELLVSTALDGASQVLIVEPAGQEVRVVPGPESEERAPWEVGVLWREGEPEIWAGFTSEVTTAKGPDFALWQELRGLLYGYVNYSFDDIDGDGTSDLVVAQSDKWMGPSVRLYRGPDLAVEEGPDVVLPNAGRQLRLKDDGLVSFVFKELEQWWVIEQTSPWSFAEARPLFEGNVHTTWFADFDGDGDDDAHSGSTVRWNTGGTFGPRFPLGLDGGYTLDVDRDGDDDLIFATDDDSCAVAIAEGLRESEPLDEAEGPSLTVDTPDAAGGCRSGGCAMVPHGGTLLVLLALAPFVRRRTLDA